MLKKNHPFTATNFANIAWVYYGQKQYHKALDLFQNAESIFINEYGARKSNLASVWNGIGCCNLQLENTRKQNFFSEKLYI